MRWSVTKNDWNSDVCIQNKHIIFDKFFSWNKTTSGIFFLRLRWGPQKVNNFPFWQWDPPQNRFCFEKYLFCDSRFISYRLPVGNAQLEYLPKENIAVKNSCLRVSLTPGHLLAPTSAMRKAPQCCWVMGVREEVGQTVVSPQPVTSSPALHAPLFTTSETWQQLTTKHAPSLKAHVSGKNRYRLFHVCLLDFKEPAIVLQNTLWWNIYL